MIDLTKESLISLAEAVRFLPAIDGRRPHANSAWRWCVRGVGGVHLEHVRVGRRVCTSKEAVSRFVNALAQKASADLNPPKGTAKKAKGAAPSKARAERIAAAEKRLTDAGM